MTCLSSDSCGRVGMLNLSHLTIERPPNNTKSRWDKLSLLMSTHGRPWPDRWMLSIPGNSRTIFKNIYP